MRDIAIAWHMSKRWFWSGRLLLFQRGIGVVGLVVLLSSHGLRKLLFKIINVNLLRAWVLDYSHQSRLQVFNILTLIHQLLEVVSKSTFLIFERFVLHFILFANVIELFDFSICEIKLLFSSFNVCNHVGLWLVGALGQFLMEFHVSFQILNSSFIGSNLLLKWL